jgi:hypothetical protein
MSAASRHERDVELLLAAVRTMPEPRGFMLPGITLEFRPGWHGLQAKDRCKPLTPLGRRVLRAHLEAQTAQHQPNDKGRP